MSKIGRKGISASGVELSVVGNTVHYKGKAAAGVHELPDSLTVHYEGGVLHIAPAVSERDKGTLSKDVRATWGLHRALLASRIAGAAAPFERVVVIVGLGFKAVLKGNVLEFSLGYSHKILYPLPEGVTVTIDKTGQKLTLRSADAELVGLVASQLRALRPPEPYKGTGVMYAEEVATLRRKEGKKK